MNYRAHFSTLFFICLPAKVLSTCTYERYGMTLFRKILFVGLIAALLTGNTATAGALLAKSLDQTILIRFHPDTPSTTRDTIIADINGQLVDRIDALGIAKVEIGRNSNSNRTGSNLTSLAAAYAPVDFVEIDEAMLQGTYTPNDPALAKVDQSHSHRQVQMLEAWDYSVGAEEVIIAVLDTGIDLSHPEFTGRITSGYDFVHDDEDATDDHGHGTHVAGILIANMDNQVGSAGVCPNCRLMPIKILNQNNSGSWYAVAKGLIYAVENGAQIINLSLGSTVDSKVLKSAIDYALSKDVIVVAAVGNNGNDTAFYPAAYEGVVAVSATNKQNEKWGPSNYGDYIDIAAPGEEVYSTMLDGVDGQNSHGFMSGTSMATPYVTGLAGLLMAQDPSRSSQDIIDLIQGTADDLGELGKDPLFGYGRVNAYAALAGQYNESARQFHQDQKSRNEIFLPIVQNK